MFVGRDVVSGNYAGVVCPGFRKEVRMSLEQWPVCPAVN